MKLKNTNPLFTNEQIRQIVNFVRPSGISNFDIWVKNSTRGWAGMAYTRGSGYHCTASPFVVIRMGNIKYPVRQPARRAYLSLTAYSPKELLIHLLAHELRHLWQAKIKRGWRVWGSRGQFSERDADAYAIHKVREYRRQGINTQEEII